MGTREGEACPAPPLLALRAGTGQASLQSVGEEAAKLAGIRALALLAGLFDGVPSRVLLAYRRRIGAEELHELRRHLDPIRLTLLAAFCHVRGREIADTLSSAIETHVGDPGLTLDQIAALTGVSTRMATKAFHHAGSSFSSYLGSPHGLLKTAR